MLAVLPRPKDTVGGRYRLLERLGCGGWAVVFKAVDKENGGDCAIKLMNGVAMEHEVHRIRFAREIAVQKRICHPNIPSYIDHDLDCERPFMAMSLAAGRSFKELCRYHPDWALRILLQVLDALEYLEQLEIVHRDVKLQNLVVNRADLSTSLCDFGVALCASEQSADSTYGLDSKQDWKRHITRVRKYVGTPAYCAPEVLRGDEATAASDLYSLSVCAYTLVTGRMPFAGDEESLRHQHLHTYPWPPHKVWPEVGKCLSDAIMRGLEKDPANRFQSAAEMRAALLACAAPRDLVAA